MSANLEAELLDAEHRRCAAMLANDLTALDVLLDPDLHFSHATGAVDNKAAYLAKMSAGRIAYLSIEWDETRVRQLSSEAALLTGKMTSVVKVEGVEKRLDNRVLAAWARTDGAWRLLAFQSTPIKT